MTYMRQKRGDNENMTEGERNGAKDVRDAKLNEDVIVLSQQRD